MTRHIGILVIFSIVLVTSGARSQPGVCGPWSVFPTPSPASEFSVFRSVAAFSKSDAWAVGEYDSDASVAVFSNTLTAHWDGQAWSVVPSPNPGLSGSALWGAAGVTGSDAWAVGYSSNFGSPNTLALHWNGSSWTQVPTPTYAGGAAFGAVVAIAANDVWAVGTRAGGLPDDRATVCTLAEHWNGSSWTVVPSPNVSNRAHDLVAVSAAAPDDIWAVGSSRNITEPFQTFAMHWNGAAWSVVPTPNLEGENDLSAVAAISSDDVWALGSNNDGIAPRPLFLHWDGSGWTIVPAPGGPQLGIGAVSGLVALASNDLWAAGSALAHWDGTAWSLVPNPMVENGASDLIFHAVAAAGPCDVWAVGQCHTANGFATLAARLTPEGGGGVLDAPPTAGGPHLTLTIRPNPFRDGGTIRLRLPEAQPVVVHVLDTSGRLVREVMRQRLDPGTHDLRWDGRDSQGRPVASGVYIVRAKSEARLASARVLLLR